MKGKQEEKLAPLPPFSKHLCRYLDSLCSYILPIELENIEGCKTPQALALSFSPYPSVSVLANTGLKDLWWIAKRRRFCDLIFRGFVLGGANERFTDLECVEWVGLAPQSLPFYFLAHVHSYQLTVGLRHDWIALSMAAPRVSSGE